MWDRSRGWRPRYRDSHSLPLTIPVGAALPLASPVIQEPQAHPPAPPVARRDEANHLQRNLIMDDSPRRATP